MRNYLTYTDDNILDGVKQVKSMAGLLKLLGLKPVGGNYANMKRKLQQIGANCEHWTGQAWNRDERLKDWNTYTRANRVKKHLIKERGHVCENCKNTHWLDNLIPLEIHHKDGNRTNNDVSNLELNCANCHSLTKGFRNRLHEPRTSEEKKLKEREWTHDTCSCGKPKRKSSNNCKSCAEIIKHNLNF